MLSKFPHHVNLRILSRDRHNEPSTQRHRDSSVRLDRNNTGHEFATITFPLRWPQVSMIHHHHIRQDSPSWANAFL
ncbi:hypothetical protein TNCV_3332181 [Trichonephila clavipes]|nr:hypothetical protein TNCV_3332181 [Trichonephila clavipes]